MPSPNLKDTLSAEVPVEHCLEETKLSEFASSNIISWRKHIFCNINCGMLHLVVICHLNLALNKHFQKNEDLFPIRKSLINFYVRQFSTCFVLSHLLVFCQGFDRQTPSSGAN